ncbi:MAG TPA: prolyl oligopeptidase family serine peptidase, partial [Kofleriaceae bacterium]|nr:prolyl oligopeptidase family serine peptidase [Kofleriaceae bacterium]
MVVESAPPLDLQIARELDAYARPSERLLDISDDGRAALITTSGDVVEVRDGHRSTRIPGLWIAWAQFAGEGAIVATADHDGDEVFQLYRQVSGGAPSIVGAGRHAGVIIDRERHRLLWASNERDGVDDDLWIAETEGIDPRPIYTGGGQWSPVAAAAGIVVAKKTVSSTSSVLYRIDAGNATALTGPGAVGDAVIGPAREIYGVATNGGDHLGIYALPDREALTPDLAWDVTAIAMSRDGRTIAFVANVDMRSVLYLLDPHTHRRWRAPNVPANGVIGDLAFAADANVLGFTYGDARHPREVYRYDIDAGTFARWDVALTPELPDTLVDPSHVAIDVRSRGLRVPALVYKPHGGGRSPVVVEFHGGPEDQWRPRYDGFTQFLVARGYAIVQPNVRGSIGYGLAYARLDDGPGRIGVMDDVGAVLDWIATQPDLDSRHVVVMGASYGGWVALSAVATFGDRLRGCIDLVGIADFVTFLPTTIAYRRAERRAEYGDERDPQVRERLTRLSPLSRVREIRRPLLVVQGARDPRVPVDGADRLVAAIRDAGQLVW